MLAELAGLALLLLVAVAIAVVGAAVLVAHHARRPERHTAGWALARARAIDPDDLGVAHTAWTLDRPDGAALPVWEIDGARPPGTTVVLVHGFGQSRIDLLARLDPWRGLAGRVVLYDRRGHGDATGRSPLGTGEADDLRGLLERLGAGRTALVGWSMGAEIAIAAAADGADLRGVVAISPYRTIAAALRRRVRLLGLARPVDDLALLLLRARGLRPRDAVADASRLTVPLLVVHGRSDDLSPLDDARAIAGAAPRGELIEIDGAHAGLTDAIGDDEMDRIVETVRAWLA